MQEDLRACIEFFRKKGQVLDLGREVDPATEVSALMKEAEKGSKVVVFNKVKGSSLPVVNNLLGTRERLAAVFETTPKNVVNEWLSRLERPYEPEIVPSGPVKERILTGEEVDLTRLPLVTHSFRDKGPYVTAGVVVARDPETGIRNVSINRMQLKGRNKLGIRMMSPQHLGRIFEKCEKLGKNLEIAVSIGNHPLDLIAATTSLSFGVDEYSLAGALRRRPLQLVKAETVELEVPATAEIVLEGEVLAGVREPEGPFGDFMQYFVPIMDNHVFMVKAVTCRSRPIYQTIQASSREDVHLLGLSREGIIYKAVSPVADVQAVGLSPTILNCAIAIKKRFEGEPKNVMAAAFGSYPWMKTCVIVDEDVDVFDPGDLDWAIATRSRMNKGLLVLENALGFSRDPHEIHTTKLGIDATAPLNSWNEFERIAPPGAGRIRLKDYL